MVCRYDDQLDLHTELCTMPRKKSSGLSGNGPVAKANTPKSTAEDEETHHCPICVEPIVDEGGAGCTQDALYCEGDCQCWMHRWCAGVTRERYVALSSTEDPFLCPSCVVAGQKVAISAQQADIACLRECVNSLTDEVRSLKVLLQQWGPSLRTALPAVHPLVRPRSGVLW